MPSFTPHHFGEETSIKLCWRCSPRLPVHVGIGLWVPKLSLVSALFNCLFTIILCCGQGLWYWFWFIIIFLIDLTPPHTHTHIFTWNYSESCYICVINFLEGCYHCITIQSNSFDFCWKNRMEYFLLSNNVICQVIVIFMT